MRAERQKRIRKEVPRSVGSHTGGERRQLEARGQDHTLRHGAEGVQVHLQLERTQNRVRRIVELSA